MMLFHHVGRNVGGNYGWALAREKWQLPQFVLPREFDISLPFVWHDLHFFTSSFNSAAVENSLAKWTFRISTVFLEVLAEGRLHRSFCGLLKVLQPETLHHLVTET